MAHAEEIPVLFDATGHLWLLHCRVLEAGCESVPEWPPFKALFHVVQAATPVGTPSQEQSDAAVLDTLEQESGGPE